MFSMTSRIPRAAAAAAAATAIAACGSASSGSVHPPGTSAAGHPTQATVQRFQQDAVRFTDCMRNHGVPDFPDPPTAADPSAGPTWKNAFADTSPATRSAEAACAHLMPRGGQHSDTETPTPPQISAMLAFARCLRSHGFPTFPDPTRNGITHAMIAGAGINLHQPAVLQTADRCVSVTHGVLTTAAVARFVAGH